MRLTQQEQGSLAVGLAGEEWASVANFRATMTRLAMIPRTTFGRLPLDLLRLMHALCILTLAPLTVAILGLAARRYLNGELWTMAVFLLTLAVLLVMHCLIMINAVLLHKREFPRLLMGLRRNMHWMNGLVLT